MPCNTDYMYDVPGEVGVNAGSVPQHVQDYLDMIVHTDDLMREELLAFWDAGTPLTNEYSLPVNVAEKIHAVLGSPASRYGLDELVDRIVREHKRTATVYAKARKGLKVTDAQKQLIRTDQIVHRHGDMMRVWEFYGSQYRKDHDMIEKLAQVDLTQPLIPQLGFDPDDV